MERDVNINQGNVESATDLRRSMIMARDVTTAHPEMVENMGVTRADKVEPFGQDLVHWGSIWGGFFTYMALVSILSAFAIAVGAVNVNAAGTNAGQAVGGIGIAVGIIMLVATFVGAVLAGWTSNIRSSWPATVNGLIYASLVITAPLLLTLFLGVLTTSATAGAVANAQALRGGVFAPGTLGVSPATLAGIGANVGWFSLGSIVMLLLGAFGYLLGMRAHLADLGLVKMNNRRST